MNKKTLWITETAVMIALLVALQWATKPLGQFVTGSCVNLVLGVSVLSPEGAEVLFLPLERIMEGCERHCEGHARLRMNLLRESAQKFWQMRHRVTYLSEPSLRRRVLLYLQDCRSRQGSDCFRLSLSREEMAAYLAVNRSALSRELSRLQQEGLIEFYRNSFRLHFSPEQLSVTEM